MYRILLFLANLLCSYTVYGQAFFDILPDVGGIGGTAMSFIAVPDSNTFKIIGHRYDTTLPGSNTKPWLGEFNYNGQLLKVIPLIDSQNNTSFNVFNNPLANKKDDVYYYYTRRDTGGVFIIPNLIELNVNTGEIYKSKLIINEQFPDFPLAGVFVNYDKYNNKIVLLNSLYKEDSVITNILLLDTLFNIEKIIEVQSVTKTAFAHWCKLNNDGTITVLGFGLANKNGENYYDFYLQKVDSFGFNTVFEWSPSELPLNLLIADTRTILEDPNGNWIISGLYYDKRPCQNCYQHIPYIFSATQDFDSLIWQTRFYDLPIQNETQYHLHSMTRVDDGFVVAADHLASDESPFPPSGVLFKASLDGDSLWMKHYIPLNWEEDRVAWVNFNDVKTTPDGNLVVAGSIGDIEQQIIRPWILHLDINGCLIPGCNTVNTEENVIVTANKKFSIFPNPAYLDIYLLSYFTSTEQYDLEIVTSDGTVIRSRSILPQSGYQYILPIDELPSGAYHLILSNEKLQVLESHTFIKQ